MRAGKLYAIDGERVGPDNPMGVPPAAHWNCRSILVPMAPGFVPPRDGHDQYTESLDDWLKRQPPKVQDTMLGPDRAALWRSGKIKARDLLGRGGELSPTGRRTDAGDPRGDLGELLRAGPRGPPGKLREAALIPCGLATPERGAGDDHGDDEGTVEESLDDSGDAGRTHVVEVSPWPCNLRAVDVFRLCAIDGIGAGMGGIAWTGISAREIRAALSIRRVPAAERADVAEDVHFMGGVVASERNQIAEARAKRKGAATN